MPLVRAAGVICLLFGLAGKVRRVPGIVNMISRFSFGIYLLHWFFIELGWRLAGGRIARAGLMGILALWVGSVAGSIALTALLGTLPIGPFLVGKLGLSARPSPAPVARPSSSEVPG